MKIVNSSVANVNSLFCVALPLLKILEISSIFPRAISNFMVHVFVIFKVEIFCDIFFRALLTSSVVHVLVLWHQAEIAHLTKFYVVCSRIKLLQ